MHDSIVQTGKWLRSVVQGYLNYHAVPGNTESLRVFRFRVTRLWRQALRRRGQQYYLNWPRMDSWRHDGFRPYAYFIPGLAFALTLRIQDKEPHAVILLVGICAGVSSDRYPLARLSHKH